MGEGKDFHVDDAAGLPMLDLNNDDPTELVNSPFTQSGTLSQKKDNIITILESSVSKMYIA